MSATLKLKPNVKARGLSGHPWVFANEVEALLPSEHDGELVECRDRTGRFIGVGLYNSKSQIIWRRLSRDRVALDETYLRGALTRSLARRVSEKVRRLVWSESDDLPGLVVDQFDDTLVVQIQTAAMEKRAALIGDLLAELTGAKEIIFRNDAPIRRLEGLPQEVHTRSGQTWEPRWLAIDGISYWLDLQNGQKTGFYLDQRKQHRAVAPYCAGKRVLDIGAWDGWFSFEMERRGAEVVAIDTIHADFRDLEGLERDCRRSRRDGFLGRMAIHPDQVAVINRCFTPSEAEIEHARRIVAAFELGLLVGQHFLIFGTTEKVEVVKYVVGVLCHVMPSVS